MNETHPTLYEAILTVVGVLISVSLAFGFLVALGVFCLWLDLGDP